MKDTLGRFNSVFDGPPWTVRRGTAHKTVATHPGCEVRTYADLTDTVATLGFHNQRLNLFFRRQRGNYDVEQTPGQDRQTSLLPAAFRRDVSFNQEWSARYLNDVLPQITERLRTQLTGELRGRGGYRGHEIKQIYHFPEKLWAIL